MIRALSSVGTAMLILVLRSMETAAQSAVEVSVGVAGPIGRLGHFQNRSRYMAVAVEHRISASIGGASRCRSRGCSSRIGVRLRRFQDAAWLRVALDVWSGGAHWVRITESARTTAVASLGLRADPYRTSPLYLVHAPTSSTEL